MDVRTRPFSLTIAIEVDADLSGDLSADRFVRLARGVTFTSCYRGVRVDGVSDVPPIFASSKEVIGYLQTMARLHDKEGELALDEALAPAAQAEQTYSLDRAALLRLACEYVNAYQARLWPGEAGLCRTIASAA